MSAGRCGHCKQHLTGGLPNSKLELTIWLLHIVLKKKCPDNVSITKFLVQTGNDNFSTEFNSNL